MEFGNFSSFRVWTKCGGRKYELPGPFLGSVGIFSQERFRHVNFSASAGKVIGMFFGFVGQVFIQAGFERARERHDPVFTSFSVVNDNGSLAEVYVFDAKAERFHEAKTGAVHELGGEFPWVFEVGYNGLNFSACEHDGRAPSSPAGQCFFQGEICLAEDFAGKKDHGVESLLLRGSGNITLQGEIIEVIRDRPGAGILRGLLEFDEAEAGEAGIPLDIGLFGGVAQAAKTDGPAQFFADSGDFTLCFWQWIGV